MAEKSVSSHVDETVLDEFDETFGCGNYGSNSRSKEIETAIELRTAVEKAWRNAPGEPPENEREKRVLTVDAIRNRVDYFDVVKDL